MLRTFREIRGLSIRATDGPFGAVSDLYFDDSTWQIRHCVVDTGRWFADRYVLVAPRALSIIDPARRELWVRLAKSEIRQSRNAMTDKPVSRQKRGLALYHVDSDACDRHLRSCRAVLGHRLDATDGRLGKVDDFMVDDRTWIIRNVVVDTNQQVVASPRVVIAPQYVEAISWPNGSVSVGLSRAEVLTAKPLSGSPGSVANMTSGGFDG